MTEVQNQHGMFEGFIYYCSRPHSCSDCSYLAANSTDGNNETVRYCRWRDGSEQMLNLPRENWC